MTVGEAQVWTVLEHCVGRTAAMSASDLAARTGLSERVARRIVKVLIEQYGCPILSSPHPPAGYYVPETLLEVHDTLVSLKGRALSILTRMARLRKIALPELVGQLQMELSRE